MIPWTLRFLTTKSADTQCRYGNQIVRTVCHTVADAVPWLIHHDPRAEPRQAARMGCFAFPCQGYMVSVAQGGMPGRPLAHNDEHLEDVHANAVHK